MSRRRVMGVLLALGITAAMGALSRVPWSAAPGEDARLRLSWRIRGEEVVACRRVSAEELEELPAHMRSPEVCDGRVTPYRLELRVDGQLRTDRIVRPAGARGDRPVFVLEELMLPPGEHRVEVFFTPTDPAASAPPLTFDERLGMAPRSATLITWNGEAERLVVRR